MKPGIQAPPGPVYPVQCKIHRYCTIQYITPCPAFDPDTQIRNTLLNKRHNIGLFAKIIFQRCQPLESVPRSAPLLYIHPRSRPWRLFLMPAVAPRDPFRGHSAHRCSTVPIGVFGPLAGVRFLGLRVCMRRCNPAVPLDDEAPGEHVGVVPLYASIA